MTTATASAGAVVDLRVDHPDDDRLGGKGRALARLVAHGAPVPPTAVVTTDVYRRVVAAGGDPARAGVRADDEAAIVAAARSIAGDGHLAVRSSATAEDLAGRSFAGQYRSLLDVDPADVVGAVRAVWASLRAPPAVAYRRAWGIDEDDVAMAVVLMRMVPARCAGVAFSVDPTGAADRVRVEVVPGLADSLVSGRRSPDVHLVPRDDPAATPAPAPVGEVARWALAVERWEGRPQDVEWAWDGERTWLVQARPITAGLGDGADPADSPVDDAELTTAGIAEMLPGVLPPLVWDLAGDGVEGALRTALDDLRALPSAAAGRRLVRRVRGRAALDLELLTAAGRRVPGAEGGIERAYFDLPDSTPVARAAAPLHRRLAHAAHVAEVRRRGELEAEIVTSAALRLPAGPRLDTLDDRELLAHLHRLVDLMWRTMAVEVAVAALAAASYEDLRSWLAGHVGDEADRWVQGVTARTGTRPAPRPGSSRSVPGGPTWTEAGGAPATSTTGPRRRAGADLTALEQRLCADPRWRRTRILTGQLVDVRLHLLRRWVADTSAGLDRRERVKAAALDVGGRVRETTLEVGRRLRARGDLADERDVELLRRAELEGALAGHGPPPAEVARRRRALRAAEAAGPLPLRFRGRPPAERAEAPVGRRLPGRAAGPGLTRGRARVVTEPERAGLGDGDVLVAVSTDPAWSPLIARAGGIVVERGGPLSHAAILARELGIPAVSDVVGAVARLDGCLVEVDGDRGVVTVLEEASAP